jgi:hypothetical protein
MSWEPENYHENDMINAIYNVAASLAALASAADGLLYGLKYGKEEGLSIAEAVEVGAGAIASAIGLIEHGGDTRP